jgi:hypothetical protein
MERSSSRARRASRSTPMMRSNLLSEGHGNAVRLARSQPDAVIALEFLNASDPVLDAWLPLEEPTAAGAPVAPSAPPSTTSFIVLGFRHILEGYDHLFFSLACCSAVAAWPACSA